MLGPTIKSNWLTLLYTAADWSNHKMSVLGFFCPSSESQYILVLFWTSLKNTIIFLIFISVPQKKSSHKSLEQRESEYIFIVGQTIPLP